MAVETIEPTDVDLHLSNEFPPHTYEQWKDAAVALLNGAPFEKLLLTPTYEGIT